MKPPQNLNIIVHHTTIPRCSPGKPPAIYSNVITTASVASKKKYLLFKRFFDIFFSVLIMVFILSWLLPVIALLIKLDSKGPVLFKQKRTGLNGKIFICLKLRTMIINLEADERPAQKNDCRITRIGKFLRQTNMDELPQFFNVLAGQMSVVGPRPHMAADCMRFSFVIPSYGSRNLIKPGITGWAQAKGYHGLSPDYESIILRYYWDAQYIRKAGLLLDIKIITLTTAKAIYNFFAQCFLVFPI